MEYKYLVCGYTDDGSEMESNWYEFSNFEDANNAMRELNDEINNRSTKTFGSYCIYKVSQIIED